MEYEPVGRAQVRDSDRVVTRRTGQGDRIRTQAGRRIEVAVNLEHIVARRAIAGDIGAVDRDFLDLGHRRDDGFLAARDLARDHDFGFEIAADVTILECNAGHGLRSAEHTSDLQSLMRTSYAVFCLK